MDHIDSTRISTFKFLRGKFHPSNSSQSEIRFDFSFKSYDKLHILDENPTSECFPSIIGHASAAVAAAAAAAAADSPPLERVAEAVGKTVGFLLLEGERVELIELVRECVRRSFPAAGARGVLRLSFKVRVEHRHVFVVAGPRMVPAATGAFELLADVDADVDADVEGRRCCICLDELAGGGGALRMPCKHVFHGECIKEWLRSSHYCPLCRYEMPTE